jgi:formylglycine-generating enzyme required for sulfatase activity
MLATRRWLLGILGLAALLPLTAQEPKFAVNAGRKFALVIGVRKYENSEELPALKYTENDAHRLAEVLKTAGYKVVVLTQKEAREKDEFLLQPTARNIRRELDTLLHPDKRTESDTVLVAFSGHGIQPKGQKEHFLCPQDADLDSPQKTLVSLGELYERMDKCKAGLKLLFTDACRSDPTEAKNAKFALKAEAKPAPQKQEKPGGIASFFSCSAGQFSYESDKLQHGLFFFYLIQGLEGKGANSKGQVTLESLASYVKSEVDDRVKELLARDKDQVPHLVSDVRGNVALLDAMITPEWVADFGDGVKLTLRQVPAGRFLMGATKEEIDQILKDDKEARGEWARREWFDDEFPRHEVEITKPFYLGVFEVTQEQFEKVMGDNPSHFTKKNGGGPKHPVEQVTWEEAVEFCKKLTAKEKDRLRGMVFRLPTEAEWEYACRGGPVSKDRKSAPFYFAEPTFALDSSLANFDGNYPYGGAPKGISLRKTTLVGAFEKPNPLGLHDMHGNVAEWCHDWYDAKFYSDPKADKDPTGPKHGTHRVNRGGTWAAIGGARYCRAADRGWYDPNARLSSQGFRVALGARIPQ